LLLRIITGIVGIVAAAYVIMQGDRVFAGATLLLALVGWFEFARAFARRGTTVAFFSGVIALPLMIGCAWLGNAEEMLGVSMAFALLTLTFTVLPIGQTLNFTEGAVGIAGVFYIGWPLSHLVMLRNLEGADFTSFFDPAVSVSYGAGLVWLMFIATWASDTFAYFVGSAIGSHKLAPSISPNKTVEGFLGSVVGTGAVLAGLAYAFDLPPEKTVYLGVCLAIIATLGDLVESAFKRHIGIKDSGSLIPGHGGVLDRFDSVLYTAPVVYYYALIFGLN